MASIQDQNVPAGGQSVADEAARPQLQPIQPPESSVSSRNDRLTVSPSAPKKEVSCNSDLQRKATAVRAGFKRPSYWVLMFGWSLAICAGFVNTVAFRTWGLYVSHATGTTTAIGMRIEGWHQKKHGVDTLTEAICLLLSFLFGAFLCGLLIDKNQIHFLGKAFYGLALIGNSALLVAAAFIQRELLAACFAAAACGLQNAMCTSHFGAIVRTTHVTGTVTDIGSTLGRMAMIYLRKGCSRARLNVIERAEVGVDARKLLVLGPMWISFLLGTIAGAYVEHLILGQLALLVPATVTFVVGSSYMGFRQTLKDYIKGLEQARLNEDLHSVHKALTNTANRLHNLPPSRQVSSINDDDNLVIELDEEMGHMMEVLQEVEADVENLYRAENPNATDGAAK